MREAVNLMSVSVLVVDDDPDALFLLRLILLRRGWAVLVARSGIEALDVAERYAPDLMLLDLMMPGMNGYELCARLRENPRFEHTPILAFTAMPLPAAQGRAIEAGFSDVISKPVLPSELVKQLERYLTPVMA
jgi:CheY-like chemotaxis protein